MRALILIGLLIASPAFAANKVLVLNDAEQQALVQALDQAIRAQGLSAAANNLHLYTKLQGAPVQVEDAPKAPEKHDNAQ